ncbi:MAG: hypothetical protein ACRD8Z_05125, partial [Nitrososphaeraceae archaeon]
LIHVAYGARLTYERAFGYTESLVESGFLLKKQTISGLYRYYEITDKGRLYLQTYSKSFEIQDNLRLKEVDTEADAWL